MVVYFKELHYRQYAENFIKKKITVSRLKFKKKKNI